MMPSSKDIKARRQLSRQLQETIETSDPDSVLNLFQAFDLTGFSYKGQMTSGYGERGTRVSFDVGFDFGALILPGLLTLEVEAGMTGQETRYTAISLSSGIRE
jgi:hypothetical protein